MSQHSSQLLLKSVICLCLPVFLCSIFTMIFSALWLLSIPAPLSCTQQSCQGRSQYFHYFTSTVLYFPNWFGTQVSTKPISWTLFPEFVAGWIQTLNSEGCSSLSYNKSSLQSFLSFFFQVKIEVLWGKIGKCEVRVNRCKCLHIHCSVASIDP